MPEVASTTNADTQTPHILMSLACLLTLFVAPMAHPRTADMKSALTTSNFLAHYLTRKSGVIYMQFITLRDRRMEDVRSLRGLSSSQLVVL